MNLAGWPRSVRATHRFVAFVVALFWCAAPVLAGVHASIEAHYYCLEHGAVEEAGEAKTQPGLPGGATVLSGAEAAPSHDGCAFGRYCRFGQVLNQVVLALSACLEPDPISPPALSMAAPVVATIVLAPKTSPPA